MLPDKYKKRSFLKFDVGINTSKLTEEFESIPNDLWASSYWGNVHCSVGMLLLRGGNSGNEKDFYCDEVYDYPYLKQLPYIEQLIAADGPFGGAKYAFLFRTIPMGVTRAHEDLRDEWFDMYRIHIPIVTNDGAFFISNDKSIHYEEGYAWSFDNQLRHGVVNGDSERVHLIFDVELNDKVANLIETAEYLPGVVNEQNIKTINSKEHSIASYPGDDIVKKAIMDLKEYGLNNEQIAAHLNSKNIPTKQYGEIWTTKSVSKFIPAIFL